jgi:hypothetical protein
MLSKEMNERLTQVGAGTPLGTLLRRYWFPILAVGDHGPPSFQIRVPVDDTHTLHYGYRASPREPGAPVRDSIEIWDEPYMHPK